MSKKRYNGNLSADKFIKELEKVPAKAAEITKELPVIVSIDGKSYKLLPCEEVDYKEVIFEYVETYLKETVSAMKGQVKEFASRLQDKIDEISLSQTKQYPPPPTLEFVMNNDMQIAVKGGLYYYILPFNYTPQLLSGRKITGADKLSREVLIFFGYDTNKKGEFILESVELRNYNMSAFNHYHDLNTVGKDCWGNISLPIGSAYDVAKLPELRDRLQNSLENINGRSLAHNKPSKLPDVKNINIKPGSVVWS